MIIAACKQWLYEKREKKVCEDENNGFVVEAGENEGVIGGDKQSEQRRCEEKN